MINYAAKQQENFTVVVFPVLFANRDNPLTVIDAFSFQTAKCGSR